MTDTAVVMKNLATLQDLALGTGQVTQTRAGQTHTLDKISLFAFVTSTTALAAIDTSKFKFAALFDTVALTISFYRYNGAWDLFNTVSDVAAIEALQADVAALDGRLDTAELDITAIEGAIVTINNTLAALANADAALDARLDTAETDIATLQASVLALGAPIDALLRLSSDDTFTTTPAMISWDAAVHQDNATFWVGGSPTRITIPNGVSRVKFHLHACIYLQNGAYIHGCFVRLTKNGATSYFPGKLALGISGFYYVNPIDVDLDAESTWIDVVPGDYFELQMWRGGGTHTAKLRAESADTQTGTWLNILGKP